MTKKTKPAVKGVATSGKAAELKLRVRHAVERADTARAVAKAAKEALKHSKKRARHTRKEAKRLRKTVKELQRQLKAASAVRRPAAKRRPKARRVVRPVRPPEIRPMEPAAATPLAETSIPATPPSGDSGAAGT